MFSFQPFYQFSKNTVKPPLPQNLSVAILTFDICCTLCARLAPVPVERNFDMRVSHRVYTKNCYELGGVTEIKKDICFLWENVEEQWRGGDRGLADQIATN